MNNDYASHVGQRYGSWVVQKVYTYSYFWKKKEKLVTIVYCDATCSVCGKTLVKRRLYDLSGGRSKRCRACYRPQTPPPLNCGDKNARWEGLGPIPKTYFSSLQSGATARGIPFQLQMQDLLHRWEVQNGKCSLSGLELKFPTKNGRLSIRKRYTETERMSFASLDRIRNDEGYVVGNIQWICLGLNLAKRDWSQESFVALCKAVAKCCTVNCCTVN